MLEQVTQRSLNVPSVEAFKNRLDDAVLFNISISNTKSITQNKGVWLIKNRLGCYAEGH